MCCVRCALWCGELILRAELRGHLHDQVDLELDLERPDPAVAHRFMLEVAVQEEQEQQQQQQQEQEGESMLADAQYTAHGHSPPYAAFNSPRPAFETSTPCAGRRGAQL